jgi:hypothetical protein
LDYQGSAIGFQCLVTSSHPRVHAAPKFLVKAASTVAVPIERIRHDYYRWMRIRFSTHDGSPIRSGWVVRVNVQLLGHWY